MSHSDGNPKMIGEAEFRLDKQSLKLPVYQGSEQEVGVDIAKLRAKTSCVTLDPGFGNTGSCTSAVTFIDGDKGILRYRGIPIEELAEQSTFLETAYLLIYGKLPNQKELTDFNNDVSKHHELPGTLKKIFDAFPKDAHPMAVLSSAISALSSYYPDSFRVDVDKSDIHIKRLFAKAITIAACAHRKSKDEPFVDPDPKLGYTENFIRMMLSKEGESEIDPTVTRALRMMFILHADHEQNCSTSTVRIVGSSQANLYAAMSAGVSALWGPWHGGANQAVIEMLEGIKSRGDSIKSLVQQVKDKSSGFRLMGFGHRVYKNFDPRAKIIKKACDEVLSKLGIHDPLLEIAKELEEAALKDEYFVQRKLYPNVDFYSGIMLRAIGIPVKAFTVIFAIGRLPGWMAHWREMLKTPGLRIYRPRQIYVGNTKNSYVSIENRN